MFKVWLPRNSDGITGSDKSEFSNVRWRSPCTHIRPPLPFILPCPHPTPRTTPPPPPPPPTMSSDTRRLLEAAMALSQLLNMHAIPHAFHGSILTAIMSDSPRCDVCPPFSSVPPDPSLSTGNILHRRGWFHPPFPPRSSSNSEQRLFHDDTFAVEQPVRVTPRSFHPF